MKLAPRANDVTRPVGDEKANFSKELPSLKQSKGMAGVRRLHEGT